MPINEDEIHLWMIDPQLVLSTVALRSILTETEQQKVDRYRSEKAKHTALITRSFIRLLLSQYETFTPDQLQFTVSDLGKPELNNASKSLRFNLSHNDELIICAVCLNKDIGCDIENLSRKINVNAIAKRFFSASEYQLIKTKPSSFFEYWTLKEAFVKATGLGISQGLETFSFEIKEQKEMKQNDNIVLRFNQNCKEKSPQNWYHSLLFPDDRHCIALSVNNKKQTDKKPTIRLFSNEQSQSLFNH